MFVCVLMFLAAFWAGALQAAPPVNDRCANAIVIPANGPFPHLTVPVDITDATLTNDPPAPPCQSDVSRSVWYVFRPALTDTYRISLCGEVTATTVADTVMAIYVAGALGCGTPYTNIANGCSDDACNLQSEISAQLNANTAYYIVVWQFSAMPPPPGESQVQLLVENSRPSNDDCTSPQPIQLNIPVSGRTIDALNDYNLGNSTCFTGIGQIPVDTPGRDVVFSFTPPTTDTYSFRVKNYNINADKNYNLVLYVSDTCPVSDPEGTMNECLSAANRNVSIAEEVACLLLTNLQTVYIFVDDAFTVNRGSSFTLEVTRCFWETETNNSIVTAQRLVHESSGGINPVGELDYFALGTFTPGSRVFALVDGIAANLPDFDLRVVNPDGVLEFDGDNNDFPFGPSSGNVAGTPLGGDPAWLRLNHSPTLSRPYRLYAVVQPPASEAVQETEPNDVLGQAQSSSKNYFAGQLTTTDRDYFAFHANAGDLLFVGLDADPMRDRTPIDAQLELLNAAGSILLSVDDAASTSNTNVVFGDFEATRPFSPAESLVFRATYSGQFNIRVSLSPFAVLQAGDYLLSITRNGFIGAGTNTPPVLAQFSAAPVPAGSNFALSGTIRDLDAGAQFAVVINWGDGSANTILNLGVGQYTFTAEHLYAQDAVYPVTVTLQDGQGGSRITSLQAQVTRQPTAYIRQLPNGDIVVEFRGTPSAAYRIEGSDNLQTWSHLAAATADGAGGFQFLDSPPRPARRFFRAVSP